MFKLKKKKKKKKWGWWGRENREKLKSWKERGKLVNSRLSLSFSSIWKENKTL